MEEKMAQKEVTVTVAPVGSTREGDGGHSVLFGAPPARLTTRLPLSPARR